MLIDLTQTYEIREIVESIQRDGYCLLPAFITEDSCNRIKSKLEDCLDLRRRKGEYIGNANYQILYNYFVEDTALFDLIALEVVDQTMRQLIDDDYVLISPSARNRQKRAEISESVETSGIGWHSDARYAVDGMTAFNPSMNYYAVFALDDFSSDNGATHYLPGTHKLHKRPPSRDLECDARLLEAKAGSLFFFDAALWHKVGDASTRPRWSIFNIYGPWFMKPYSRFTELFPAETAARFSPRVRQLLHFDSTPPRDQNERLATLVRP